MKISNKKELWAARIAGAKGLRGAFLTNSRMSKETKKAEAEK
jgi:hypothetical protein